MPSDPHNGKPDFSSMKHGGTDTQSRLFGSLFECQAGKWDFYGVY